MVDVVPATFSRRSRRTATKGRQYRHARRAFCLNLDFDDDFDGNDARITKIITIK